MKQPYLKAPIPENERQRLESLYALGLLDTPTEKRFDRITRLALSLFNVPISTVTLIDSRREWFKSCQGLGKREGRRAISFCGHALVSEEILVIPDTKKDPKFAKNPMVLGKPYIRFYAGVPLRSADGQRVGVFCIKDIQPGKFDDKKQALLKSLASWAELELNVHELSSALEARNKAEKQTVELNEALKLINKTIRHDILNDLTVVKVDLELYLNKKRGEQIVRDASRVVERSVKFIQQMREVESAVSVGALLKPYSIKEVIKEVSRHFMSMKLKIEGDGIVLADEALISVVENIIRNALIHGGINKIEAKIKKDKEFIEISLADWGVGIPDEIKAKLFTEGVKYGKTGNSGLGLYIAKKTIARYGGQIWVEDNKPKGAKFVIKLPQAK